MNKHLSSWPPWALIHQPSAAESDPWRCTGQGAETRAEAVRAEEMCLFLRCWVPKATTLAIANKDFLVNEQRNEGKKAGILCRDRHFCRLKNVRCSDSLVGLPEPASTHADRVCPQLGSPSHLHPSPLHDVSTAVLLVQLCMPTQTLPISFPSFPLSFRSPRAGSSTINPGHLSGTHIPNNAYRGAKGHFAASAS